MDGFSQEQAIEIIKRSQIKARSNLAHRTQMPSTALSLVTAGCGLYLGVLAAPALSPLVLITAFAAVPAVTVMAVSEIFITHEENKIQDCDRVTLNRYCDMRDLEYIVKTLEADVKKPMPPAPETGANPGAHQTQEKPQSKSNSQTEAGSESTKSGHSEGVLQWPDGEHLIMIGLSGSSKTTTLIQCVPEDSIVLYVTIKEEDVAPKHWVACRLPKFANAKLLRQLDNLCDIIESLVQRRIKHRLIVDEAVSILDAAKDAVKVLSDEDKKALKGVPGRFEVALKTYIRVGRSDGHYLGLVSQSPNGTDLFDSAKTMQGLKTVLCAGAASSNKFSFVGTWSRQLFKARIQDAQVKFLETIQSGFWHFWMDALELKYAHSQKSTVELVLCPVFSKTDLIKQLGLNVFKLQLDGGAGLPHSVVYSPPSVAPKYLRTDLLEVQCAEIILDYMRLQNAPVTPDKIRSDRTQHKDGDKRMTREQVRQLLVKLEGEQKVRSVTVAGDPAWELAHPPDAARGNRGTGK